MEVMLSGMVMFFQGRAVVKHLPRNGCHAAADGDAGQAFAALEHTLSHRGNTVGDDDLSQL